MTDNRDAFYASVRAIDALCPACKQPQNAPSCERREHWLPSDTNRPTVWDGYPTTDEYREVMYVPCAECGHTHYDAEARTYAVPCHEVSGVDGCDCHGQIDHSAQGNCNCYPQCAQPLHDPRTCGQCAEGEYR